MYIKNSTIKNWWYWGIGYARGSRSAKRRPQVLMFQRKKNISCDWWSEITCKLEEYVERWMRKLIPHGRNWVNREWNLKMKMHLDMHDIEHDWCVTPIGITFLTRNIHGYTSPLRLRLESRPRCFPPFTDKFKNKNWKPTYRVPLPILLLIRQLALALLLYSRTQARLKNAIKEEEYVENVQSM